MNVVPRDCFVPAHDLVSFEAARRTALALVGSAIRSEAVPLSDARGRVLAETVIAPRPLPAFDQAAMDGYAYRRCDVQGEPPLLLPVAGKTEAGDLPSALVAGAAHRITTGAAMPHGADVVVMQEEVTLVDGTIALPLGLSANAHIRRAGEDIARGAKVLAAGRAIGWPEVTLLAALGIAAVPVAAIVKIAVLATGSELVPAGEPASASQRHDSNGPMLAALLAAPGVAVETITVGDELGEIAQLLAELSATADVVVTTAGVADGSRDHVRAAVLQAGGTLDVVKVAMKPGKPLALGRIGRAAFVGLPGNPQAAAFAALAFVRPMIDMLRGMPVAKRLTARLAVAQTLRAGRTELVPMRVACEDGTLLAYAAGPEGSHRLAPIAAADAVAVIPGSDGPVAAGTPVEILPFDRFGCMR